MKTADGACKDRKIIMNFIYNGIDLGLCKSCYVKRQAGRQTQDNLPFLPSLPLGARRLCG